MAKHAKIVLAKWEGSIYVPHFTRIAVGEWLEYPDPKKGIGKVLERNPYIETYSVVVRMTTTDGKAYETRVYHPQGFLLICMESQTAKARAMKEAIAAFVWHHLAQPKMAIDNPRLMLQCDKQLIAASRELALTTDPTHRQILKDCIDELSRLLGRPVPDLTDVPEQPLWVEILAAVLDAAAHGRYPHPIATRYYDGQPCLCLRPNHVMNFIADLPRWRPRATPLPRIGLANFRAIAHAAGIIVRARVDFVHGGTTITVTCWP